LLVEPGKVIIRPLDYVPGYVVPDGHAAMTLIGSDGGLTGVSIPTPLGNYITSDGSGYPLFTGADGVYDAQPGGSTASRPGRW
jgi:hypothetical protein